MKDLGTISMYFNFVDAKTASVMKELMKKSYNYFDFSNLLTERVFQDITSHFLPFMAVLHSWKLWDMHSLTRLSKMYSKHPLVRPYLLDIKSSLGEEVDWQGVLDSTKAVLDTNPEKWIALHMHRLDHDVVSGSHRAKLRVSPLASIGNLLRKNSELSCFSSDYWFSQAALWTRIEDQDRREAVIVRGIDLARKYNDRYSEGYGLRALAALSYTNIKQVEVYLRSADAIFEELGHKLGLADNLGTRSGVFQIKGNYDAALECLFESIRLREALGLNSWIIPTNVAWIYNIIGDYRSALEWSDYALMSICMCDNILGYPHLQRARALINVGRTKEALEHLDSALQYALKEGDERLMKLYDVASSLLQRAEGNIRSALLNLERYFNSDYSTLNDFDINEYLLLLAETELFAFNPDEKDPNSEHAGPWMEQLEHRARENELAGFLGLALLLKARLRLKQNRVFAAKCLVDEAQQMGQIYNMDFLSKRAEYLSEKARLIDL